MTCNPATCTNGKCNATGECVEAMRPGTQIPLAVRLRDESGPPLPQMVAQRREQIRNGG